MEFNVVKCSLCLFCLRFYYLLLFKKINSKMVYLFEERYNIMNFFLCKCNGKE